MFQNRRFKSQERKDQNSFYGQQLASITLAALAALQGRLERDNLNLVSTVLPLALSSAVEGVVGGVGGGVVPCVLHMVLELPLLGLVQLLSY